MTFATGAPRYAEGTEGFLLLGLDTMPAGDATTVGAAPPLSLVGLTNTPGYDVNDNATGMYGNGMFDPAVIKDGRRDITVTGGNALLSGGDGVLLLIKSALRDADAAIPNTNRALCQPIIALASGAYSECDPTAIQADIARGGMIGNLTITGQVNAPWRIEFDGVFVAMPGITTLPAGIDLTRAAIIAAAGEPFVWAEAAIDATLRDGSTLNIKPRLRSISLAISTGAHAVDATRDYIADATSPDGEAALSRTTVAVRAGQRTLSYNLTFTDPLPQPISALTLSFAGPEYDDGEGGTTQDTRIIVASGCHRGQTGRGAVESDSPFGYTQTGQFTGFAIS